MTPAEVSPSVERGARAALYTKEDGFGLWEPVRVLSLAWAADDLAGAQAPVRVILAAALDVEEMAQFIDPTIVEPFRSKVMDAWRSVGLDAEKYMADSETKAAERAAALRAAILGDDQGEADPGLLLILAGAIAAVLAGAAVLAFVAGVFG